MKRTIKNVYAAAAIGVFGIFAIASVDDDGSSGSAEETSKVKQAASVFNVTDKEIAKAFDENEVAANLKYENKVGTVTGNIIEISKDFGIYTVMLDGGDWTGVQCNFAGNVAEQLAPLKTGQRISIKGFCDGMYGNVVFENSVIVAK